MKPDVSNVIEKDTICKEFKTWFRILLVNIRMTPLLTDQWHTSVS
jgi:hypothetical protein